MASSFDRSDWGIVFYGASLEPFPTYTDVRGRLQMAVNLPSGSGVVMDPSVESAYFHVGAAGRFTFEVDVQPAIDSSMTCEVTLLGHSELDPAQSFGALSTYRNDTQKTLATHVFAQPGRYILQTANLGAIAEGTIQVKLTDGDGTVFARLRVEP